LRKHAAREGGRPVIWQIVTQPGLELFTASTLPATTASHPRSVFTRAGRFRDLDDVIVDDYFAGMKHVKVGDTIEILNHHFRVCGIVAHGRERESLCR
jgi:hypothetical protein